MCDPLSARSECEEQLLRDARLAAVALTEYVTTLVDATDDVFPKSWVGPTWECRRAFMESIVKASCIFDNDVAAGSFVMKGIEMMRLPILDQKPVEDWLTAITKW